MAERKMPMADDADIPSYPSNSIAVRKEESNDQTPPKRHEVKQVANAKTRKQSLLWKLGKSMMEDTVASAKERAFSEIVVPGFKNLIFDTLTEILSISLFGEKGSSYKPTRGTKRNGNEYLSYRDYYNYAKKDSRSQVRYHDSFYEPDDIIVDTRGEADLVLDNLFSLIQQYGQASVTDLYDSVGVTSDWTDNRYGWTDLRGASVRPVRDGYMLILPKTRILEF